MTTPKKKLTREQKAEKKKRRAEYMTVFMNGEQKRIKRPPTIDGIPVEDFILRNADPIWLHRNEMWEYIDQNENRGDTNGTAVHFGHYLPLLRKPSTYMNRKF